MKRGFLIVFVASTFLTFMMTWYNPGKRATVALNNQRKIDLEIIATALRHYQADNGKLPDVISLLPKNSVSSISATVPGVNLCSDLVPKYLEKIPVDPIIKANNPGMSCPNYDTRYRIEINKSIKISAFYADMIVEGKEVSITL